MRNHRLYCRKCMAEARGKSVIQIYSGLRPTRMFDETHGLNEDVDRGYRRFWAKRGGVPFSF